jgi:hypothetical protein
MIYRGKGELGSVNRLENAVVDQKAEQWTTLTEYLSSRTIAFSVKG